MAQEQKKTSKDTNSRRRGSVHGHSTSGPSSRIPSRKIGTTRRATAPRQDTVLVTPPKYHRGSMYITPLDGLDEVGHSMNVVEYSGHLLLIDCSILFPKREQPGVGLILPNFSYIESRLDEVDVLVLTHGHEDHINGVPHLPRSHPDIPLIGSKLIPTFMDTKRKKHHQNPAKVEVAGREKFKVGLFDLKFVDIIHSIPGALAVYVKTPVGFLIDTGDIKLDQLPLDHRITDLVGSGKIDEKGVGLLMMDSTNAEVFGFVKPETSIGPALGQAFIQTTRKITVASFSSHMHRVRQVVDAAYRYNRKAVLVGRLMVRNMSIAANPGYLHIPEGTIVDLRQANDIRNNKPVLMCTGSQGEPMTILDRIADGNHHDIHISKFDTVILASSLIPGNEHGIYEVIDKFVQLSAGVTNHDNASVHTSSHCNKGELLYMYNIVEPKCVMPIHSESRRLVASDLVAAKTGVDPQSVVLTEDGDVVDLCHGRAVIVGPVSCSYVYVDGDSIDELADDELEERHILGTKGFISAFVVVDTDSHEVVTDSKIYLNTVTEDESEFDRVRHQIVEQLSDQMMQDARDTYELQQTMCRMFGGRVARQLHRKPTIVPVMADIIQDIETIEARQSGSSGDDRKE